MPRRMPHACSSTDEATDVADFSSSSGIEPRTPTCSRKYRLMMPRIDEDDRARDRAARVAHLGAEVRGGVVAQVVVDRR